MRASAARAMQHRAVLHGAAQHPHQAELAAMAAMEGLEDLHHRLAAGFYAGARRHRGHFRHFMAQGLEQAAHAIVAFRRADQHRHHQAFRQFALRSPNTSSRGGSTSPSNSSIRCSS